MYKERRRQFLIDKPLQLRFMFTVTLVLLLVTSASLVAVYFGIWGNVISSFSDEQLLNDMVTASRLEQYEEARRPTAPPESFSSLSLFRQAERLSDRQREVFKEILNRTNHDLAGKFFLLLIMIAWGTIFLSHKIAGPLFRFQQVLLQLGQKDLSVRCKLRKFDEAKSVSEAFNLAVESLDQSVSRIKKMAEGNAGAPDRNLSQLKEELSKFKTTS